MKLLSQSRTLQIVINQLAPRRLELVIAVFVLTVAALAYVAMPWIMGKLVGVLTTAESHEHSFIYWLQALALILLVQFCSLCAGTIMVGLLGEDIQSNLRRNIHLKVLNLPLRYTSENNKGDLISLLSNEAGIVSYFFSHHMASFIPQIITLVGSICMLVYINVWFGGFAVFSVLLLVYLSKRFGRSVRDLASQVMEENKHTISVVEQDILLAEEVKTLSVKHHRHEKFVSTDENYLKASKAYIIRQNTLAPLASFFGSMMLLVAVFFLYFYSNEGAENVSAIVSLLLYGLVLMRPISVFAAMYGHGQRTFAALNRLDAYFDMQDEIIRPKGKLEFRFDDFQTLEFKDVCFSYNDDQNLLQQCNFRIARGEKVFITGDNGTGKSSIAKLVLQLYQPGSGIICLNDRDIAEYELESLRSGIGYVGQHANFFSGSIYDNLAIGLENTSKESTEAMLRMSGLWPWISCFPQGMDTSVSELGLNLSGGQRQKLSLCRAFLRNTHLVILDEPTSMFDNHSEAAFSRTLRQLLKDRSALIITHRTTPLDMADRIYELHDRQLTLLTRDPQRFSRSQ